MDMKATASQLIDALDELLNEKKFISETDSAGYGAFQALVGALIENKNYMNLPDVEVEINEAN